MRKLLFALLLCGCGGPLTTRSIPINGSRSANVIELDGCEYIWWRDDGLTHKGNCKYCRQWAEERLSHE